MGAESAQKSVKTADNWTTNEIITVCNPVGRVVVSSGRRMGSGRVVFSVGASRSKDEIPHPSGSHYHPNGEKPKIETLVNVASVGETRGSASFS